jgi:RHS repeat-associated protein
VSVIRGRTPLARRPWRGTLKGPNEPQSHGEHGEEYGGGAGAEAADAAGLPDVLSVEGASPQLYVRGTELSRAVGPSLNRVYHEDAWGTVEAATDGAGALETRYATDAFGEVLSGSAAGNPYVYHGGLGYWEESAAGLKYVRARWLEAETGSWLSVDPMVGEPRYGYADNAPTLYADASGLQPRPVMGRVAPPRHHRTDRTDLRDYLARPLPPGSRPDTDENANRVKNLIDIGRIIVDPGYRISRLTEVGGQLILLGVGTFVLAEATTKQLLALLPERITKESAEYRQNPGNWIRRLGEAFGKGVLAEIGDTFDAKAAVKEVLDLLSLLWQALGQADMGVDLLWTKKVQDPLLESLQTFLGGDVLEPEVIGEMMGRVYWEILVTILIAVIVGVITSGAGSAAVVALKGTKLWSLVEKVQQNPRYAAAIKGASGLKKRIQNHDGAKRIVQGFHQVEAARDQLRGRLHRATYPVCSLTRGRGGTSLGAQH